jgi:hypothetical protein
MKRVWVVLQINKSEFPNSVDVVGVYTDHSAAENVRAKLKSMYSQDYYIQDVLLDLDIWKDK